MWKWIIWGSGLALTTLVMFAAFTVMWMGADEYLCFDRNPWWGPPESGDPDAYCSGHMWQLHEEGYPWYGLFFVIGVMFQSAIPR